MRNDKPGRNDKPKYDKPIPREHLNSTAVLSAGYDEANWVLQVKYSTGKVYNYFRVPAKEYADLKKAASKGEYVNRQIKPYYEYEEVETEEA